MGGYTQLTQEEQYQICILKKAGDNQTEIADMLERDKSTIFSLRCERCCNLPWILPRTIRLAHYRIASIPDSDGFHRLSVAEC
jgi:hypothetical protein